MQPKTFFLPNWSFRIFNIEWVNPNISDFFCFVTFSLLLALYATIFPIVLEPLHKELKLLKEGMKVNIPTADTDTYSSKLIKAILIAGTFDLPARCLISGTVQFNGKYGCIKCLQQGERRKSQNRKRRKFLDLPIQY